MARKTSSKYQEYSSQKLIKKINSWCNDTYLNSIQYAAARESLIERIRFLRNYHRKNLLDIDSELQRLLIFDYSLFCKYECNNWPVVIDYDNQHMNKFYKNLQKQLSSELNKLDRCWGYRGVRGYGINYGKCHLI